MMNSKDKEIVKRVLRGVFLQDLRYLDMQLFLDCWYFDMEGIWEKNHAGFDSMRIVADQEILNQELESWIGFGTDNDFMLLIEEFLEENREELYSRYLWCKKALG